MPKLHIKKEDNEITLLDEQDVQEQFNNLSTVATTGNYNDLTNKPTIDSQLSTTSNNSVQNKIITNALNDKANTNSLSTVATSGSYNDLTNKPSIPNIESVYEITSNKGTASEDTMGKLYIEIKDNKRDVYYTSDTTELGYFYFEKDSGKLHVYGNFYDPEKYYYLLKDEYQIVDLFEYDNYESLWVIPRNINYIDGNFAIGISDTEVEEFDDATTVYMNPSNGYYVTDYYRSLDYISDIENNVSSQYIDIVQDNDYNWHKLDDDVLDNLSIRWVDIQGRPSIPTKTSDLTNDSDFVEENDLSTVATSGDYNDLTNKPNIPSDIEDLNPSTTTFTITYTDDTTEDIEVVIIPNNNNGA